MKVMVGGTFDPLHDGHRKLIRRSFTLAGEEGKVIIGLTTDSYASGKTHAVRPFEERRQNLIRFITENRFSSVWEIEPLSDRYGTAPLADFDALVVSEETVKVAMEINHLRQQKGKRKVDIHQIACVLADDGRWISSTRILRGEIDERGRILK